LVTTGLLLPGILDAKSVTSNRTTIVIVRLGAERPVALPSPARLLAGGLLDGPVHAATTRQSTSPNAVAKDARLIPGKTGAAS
jgi:hypothetical protein